MAELTILQSSLFREYLIPFLLIWTIIFAILQKTKLLGEGKMQLDAIVSAVIGLMFIGALGPKELVGNMILFLTVAMIIIFVVLILWGFAVGGDFSKPLSSKGMKWFLGILIGGSVIISLLYFSGYTSSLSNFLYDQNWSSSFWTNFFFVVIIAIVLAFVLKTKKV
ncbi:MAG: hypothetical protein ABIH28_02925 [archaeon]